MKLALCSANVAKLAEIQPLFPDDDIELLAADYPPEAGATYLDNALIKARHGRRVGPADRWMLADDSGIEFTALGGEPGVHTARWAQGHPVERALAALEGETNRSARYVCELVCIIASGTEVRGTGVLEGSIAKAPAGDEGFGFDPLFVPVGCARTVAELGDVWKLAHSHRALAAAALRSAPGFGDCATS